jgi:hypothetical protein
MRGQVSFWVVVIAVLAAGCGGGSGGGPTFSTCVPSGSAVNTLAPAQLMQLCNDIDRRAAASRDDRAGGWPTRLLNDQKFETIGPRIVSNRLSRRKNLTILWS